MKQGNKLVLTGSMGQTTLRRMVSALVRAMKEPGLSPSMALKLTREINALRAELVKMRIEQARRKAAETLAEPSPEGQN